MYIGLRLVDLNNYLDIAKNDNSVLFRILSVILGVKICKKRVYGNEKMSLTCAFLECARSLHFTLLQLLLDI